VYQYIPVPMVGQGKNVGGTCDTSQDVCVSSEEWESENGKIQNMGAYLTSSFEGGIVQGQLNYFNEHGAIGVGEYVYSVIDPSGTTHKLDSEFDASNPLTPTSTSIPNWNIYHDPDGSGYTFIPTIPAGTENAYDPGILQDGLDLFDSNAVWIATPLTATGGVRLGTLYSPTGIQYTDTIRSYTTPLSNTCNTYYSSYPFCTPHLLFTTAQDPSGNKITRGPWYWSGYYSLEPSSEDPPFPDIQAIYAANPPHYVDSVGRVIPDVIAMQATKYQWVPNNLTGGYSMNWNIPGPGNTTTIPYTINYINTGNSISWSYLSGLAPDPSIDVAIQGWAISSIVLPNHTSWGFKYYQNVIGVGYTDSGPNGSNLLPNELDSPGDLEEITTPSGGTISYRYMTIPFVFNSELGMGRCNTVCHAVASRTETDGVSENSWTTYYSYGDSSTIGPSISLYFGFTTTETDPNYDDTVHTFTDITGGTNVPVANQYHEVETQYYQGTGSRRTLLKTVQTTAYEYQPDIGSMASTQVVGVVNVLPTTITTSIQNGTLTPLSTTDVRQYSQLFSTAKIGCFMDGAPPSGCRPDGAISGQTGKQTIPIYYLSPTTETTSDASGNVLSTTSTTFMFQNPISAAYTSANMVALPRSVQVSAGNPGTLGYVSGTTSYGYDETSELTGNITPPCVAQPYPIWGNLTSKAETYSMGGSTAAQTVYDCHGMPITKIDGNRNQTNITYDSSGLFASSVQRPTTNGVTHIDQYMHDLDTSELLSHTDENNQTTSYSYDVMGRVTSINYPGGGVSTFCYTDTGGSCPEAQAAVPPQQTSVPYSLYTNTKTGTTTNPILTMHNYDGWGRQYQSSVLSDPQGQTTTNTAYDWEGRVTSVNNPYRSPSSPGDPPPGTTSYTYDALGRKTIQTQPDGSKQQWCYDGIGTVTTATGQSSCPKLSNYFMFTTPAGWTDVWDETGRHTQQVFDALGHLGTVTEPDPVSGDLALQTDYTYDVFGDLLTVNQLGASGSTPVLQRQFYYDMPSRVSMACNPEALGLSQNCNMASTGTWYSYDANSNLIQKIDNRNITTRYAYDALNRLLSKTYLNDLSGTASSFYQYDGSTANNLSGRLVAQWTQQNINCSSTNGNPCPSSPPGTGVLTKTAISAYDAMGRLLSEKRCMGVASCANNGGYAMNYTYDLAGKLLTYPSGYGNLAFTNSYDAVGRLLSVTQGSGQSLLFSVPSYTPAGALSGVQLGTALSMSRTFDSRQRVTGETDAAIPQ
jgi:YD repeat-containing protein